MTTFVSGDLMVQLTDAGDPTDTSSSSTYINMFDDFFRDEALATEAASDIEGIWLTDEDDSTGTVCVVTDTNHEGTVDCVSGTAGSLTDTVCLSFTDVTDQHSLISNGVTAIEARLQYNDASGTQIGVSLLDIECAATGLEPVDIDSNVVTFLTGTYNDGVGFALQDDADDTDAWQPWCANTDVECNDGGGAGTGDEYEAYTSAGVNTYETLRVEVDATGDCYFWAGASRANLSLVYAENQCVATTATLAPFIWVNTSDVANDATTIQIDYIEFALARPAS